LHHIKQKHPENRYFRSAFYHFKTIPFGIISKQRYNLFFIHQNWTVKKREISLFKYNFPDVKKYGSIKQPKQPKQPKGLKPPKTPKNPERGYENHFVDINDMVIYVIAICEEF